MRRDEHTPTESETVSVVWAIEAEGTEVPSGMRSLGLRMHSDASGAREPDPDALELVRGAGLHLDQQVLAAEDRHELVLVGDVALGALADAIVAFARPDGEGPVTRALTVAARSRPLRLTEIGAITSPFLVIESAQGGARQVPPERDAVIAALRSASAGDAAPGGRAAPAEPVTGEGGGDR